MAEGRDRAAVVLDRQPLWLEAVEAVLAANGVTRIWKTTDVEEAAALVGEHRPDLFVMEDYAGDGAGDGLALLRRVLDTLPGARSIVLSDDHDPAAAERTVAAGATAYVFKTARPEDLAATVRQLFSSSVYFARSAADVQAEFLPPPHAPPLTEREVAVLRLVGDGLSNAEVARNLSVSEQTVKFHLSNIYRKLSVSNRTQAARWAQKHPLFSRIGRVRSRRRERALAV
jgi:DNA-binding NarL/FixJ family response regulator